MKLCVVVLLLLSFLIVPVGTALAIPYCDWALESGKVVDWIVCGLFAWFIRAGEYDHEGNIGVRY